MKTLNYSKLARRVLSLASLVATGTVVSLPASAQVESPSLPMGAPSLESPVDTPDASTTPAKPESSDSTSVPTEAVDSNPIESTLETVEEIVSPDASEATEATETTETTTETTTEATETTTPDAVTEEATETTETTETTTPDAVTETTETTTETTETTSEATETAPDAVTEEATETTETTETVESPAESSEASPTGASPAQTTTPTTTPTSEVPSTATPTIAAAPGTIVDVASASNTFKTLVSALTEAELAEVLQGEGPFTVFAPTDEAFAALPEGTLDELLKPENRELLVKILTYHVVPGEILSTDLASGDVDTVEGNPVTVAVDGSSVTVNDANVIQADIPASNGVIHAIDRVIIPPDLQ